MVEEIVNQPETPNEKKTALKTGLWIFAVYFLVICCLGILIAALFGGAVYLAGKGGALAQGQPIFSATATAFPEWPLVFKDDFSQVSGKWWTGSYKGNDYEEQRAVKNGVFNWNISTENGYAFWDFPDIGRYADFYLSVDVKHINGDVRDRYGLIFRNTGNSHYVFSIRDNQTYSIYVYYLDDWITLVDDTFSAVIVPKGSNHLGVRAEGQNLFFFINDELVNNIQDNRLAKGEVGIVEEPWSGTNINDTEPQGIAFSTVYNLHTEVEYDNFELRAPSDSKQNPSEAVQLPPIIPSKGKIVFASNRDGNSNIYVINSDGSDQKQITDDPAEDYAPKWSPDGKKIAFVSNRDGNAEIYIIDADGKNPTRLTNNPAEDTAPDWSPDGKKIVFISTRDEQHELYIMDVQEPDKAPFQLTKNKLNEYFPSWSPTGAQILFQANDLDDFRSTFLINTDGTQEHRFNQGFLQSTWSPDGNSIVYVYELYKKRTSIGIFNLKTNNDEKILEPLKNNLYPAWSPDGQQIVFTSDRDGQTDLYITNLEGTGIFRVTHNEAVEESPDWVAP